MRPAHQPTSRKRNRNRCIRLLLDGPLDDIGKARRCVLSLSIEVFSRACGLSRLSLELRLGIASHSAAWAARAGRLPRIAPARSLAPFRAPGLTLAARARTAACWP